MSGQRKPWTGVAVLEAFADRRPLDRRTRGAGGRAERMTHPVRARRTRHAVRDGGADLLPDCARAEGHATDIFRWGDRTSLRKDSRTEDRPHKGPRAGTVHAPSFPESAPLPVSAPLLDPESIGLLSGLESGPPESMPPLDPVASRPPPSSPLLSVRLPTFSRASHPTSACTHIAPTAATSQAIFRAPRPITSSLPRPLRLRSR